MALADTARLIASLELQDKGFTKNAGQFDRTVTGLDKKMSTLSASGQRLGAGLSRAFSTIAKIGAGVAVGGIAALAVNIKAGVSSLAELEKQNVATATVIESTNGIAGQSAKDIRALAEEYESLNATIDDKVIQSGENLLLTFTNIRKKAFEPALEAALNMNEAMGGGESGLQSTIIQVGKALNDPIKGATALRRVGVQLTEAQQDQIKVLVEQNDLYGAQQIILGELETEFGGRFAAAGKTAEGSMARLGDAVEGLQQNLAGPLLPAIDRIRDKLADFLGSKQAQNAAKELGDAIAGIFTNKNIDKGVGFLEDALQTVRRAIKGDGEGGGFEKITANIGTITSTVAGLPWAAIGDAARLLGTGSKALLDAFLGLPPWVQTAVLTGWGLNKLTGGALTGIVGELSKGLIKGVLGITAGVVKINAGTVVGAGGGGGVAPVPGGGGAAPKPGRFGGPIATTVKNFGALASVPLTIVAIEKVVEFAGDVAGSFDTLDGQLDSLPRRNADELEDSIDKVEDAIATSEKSALGGLLGITDRLRDEKAELEQLRSGLQTELVRNRTAALATGRETASRLRSGFTDNGAKVARMHSDTSGHLSRIRDEEAAANTRLEFIKNKKTNVNVTVNTETNVALSASSTALYVQRITTSNNVNAPQPGAVS